MEWAAPRASRQCVRLPAPARALAAGGGALAAHAGRALFLYAEPGLADSPGPAHLVTDFSIHQVILGHTTGVCIDSNGAAHTFPLKLKSGAARPARVAFSPKAQGVLCGHRLGRDAVLSLSRAGAGRLLLSLHRLTTNFTALRTFPVDLEATDRRAGAVLRAASVDTGVRDVFGDVARLQEPALAVFTLDGLTLHGQVVDARGDGCGATARLFTCPSDICDFHLNGTNIIVGLKYGTVINLSLKEKNLKVSVQHLNTSLYSFIPLSETRILYTDGLGSWTADVRSQDAAFTKIPISQPKHFVLNNDTIHCVTFSNLLYSFPAPSDAAPDPDSARDGFVSVPADLSSSKRVVAEIMKEVERNEELLKKIKSENTVMLAVALSKNSAILNHHTDTTAHIVDSYVDVASSAESVVLTRPLRRYLAADTRLLLLSLRVSTQVRHKFSEMCACLPDLRLHIGAATAARAQAAALPLGDCALDNLNILVPVAGSDASPAMDVTVEIISPLRGPADPQQTFWTVMCSKRISLSAEHFIKTRFDVTAHEKKKTQDETIMEIARRNLGALFHFHLTEEDKSAAWSCYLQLPQNYQEILGKKETYEKTLSAGTSSDLAGKLASAEFAACRQTVRVCVCEARVDVQRGEGEGERGALRLHGPAPAAWRLRQFLSARLHGAGAGAPRLALHSHYARIENLRRRLRGARAGAAVLDIARQFHKHALGALPL